MATFRQIHVRIWQDKKVEELSPLGKLLFVYSWSNTYRNEACLYELTKRKITNETGIDIKAVDEVLAELERAGLIRYDHENSYIWVINALKYQSINVNNMTAILRDIHTCKSSLAVDFAEYYRDLIQFHIDKYSMPWVWDDNGVPTPYESHSGKGKGKGKDKGKSNITTPISPPQQNKLDEFTPGELEGSGGSEIYQTFEKEFGRLLSPFEIETLNEWMREFSLELILHALRVAVLGQNRSFRYIGGILTRWKGAGVKCVQDVEVLEKRHQEGKRTRVSPREKSSVADQNAQVLEAVFGGET